MAIRIKPVFSSTGTANRVAVFDPSTGLLVASVVTVDELELLSGVTGGDILTETNTKTVSGKTFNQDLLPDATNEHDLGSSGVRWKDAYLSGDLTVGDDATIAGDLIVTGDLTVNGTTTTLNTATLEVEDANILINNGGNDASSEGAGITVERTAVNAALIHADASATKFRAGAAGSEVDLVGTSSTQSLTNKTIVAASNTITTAASGNLAATELNAALAELQDSIDNIDHGAIGGLSDDDHTQYALLAGRATGQTLKGGTASGEDLTLMSTADATKGQILFGSSVYDENTNQLGVGTNPGSGSFPTNGLPGTKLHVFGSNAEIKLESRGASGNPTRITFDKPGNSLTNTTSGEVLGIMGWAARISGSANTPVAQIYSILPTTNVQSGDMVFLTGNGGSPAEKFRIKADGTLDTTLGAGVVQSDSSGILSSSALAASSITSTPAGNLAADDVQEALDELQTDIDSRALASALTDHTGDTADAHDASAISSVASGNLAATDVQTALDELQTDIDTRALDSDFDTHVSDTTTHGTTGNVVGTSDTQALTNKDIDGGTASNTSRITVPKAAKATLDALTRKEGTLVYASDEDALYVDDGATLIEVGSGAAGGSESYTGYAKYTHVLSSGTAGGNSSNGTNIRALNTEDTDNIGISLASNQLTVPAGTYDIRASCFSYRGGMQRAQIYNATDTAILLRGINYYAEGSENNFVAAHVSGRFTIAGSKAIELQHIIATGATNGLGLALSVGTEIYSQVEIWKVGS